MIEWRAVSKQYRDRSGREVLAVDDVSLQVDTGMAIALVGTSGSGKTTLLRMVNALVRPSQGEVTVEGRSVGTTDPIELRRGIGYVVQEGGLFPHLTVRQNIDLLGRLEGSPAASRTSRVDELLNLVGLAEEQFSERYPRELSGGQRQRVGIARALFLDPPLVLMDEPFGALDPLTRRDLVAEFDRLRRRFGKTVVLVTHDLDEASRLADRIAVLHDGRVRQVGTSEELHRQPADAFVERFVTEPPAQAGATDA